MDIHNHSLYHSNANQKARISASDFDSKDLKILQAIPKRGIVDISDLSGKTLCSPSNVQITISKLEKYGVIRSTRADEKSLSKALGLAGIKRHVGRTKSLRKHFRSVHGIQRKNKAYSKSYKLSLEGKELKEIIDKINL